MILLTGMPPPACPRGSRHWAVKGPGLPFLLLCPKGDLAPEGQASLKTVIKNGTTLGKEKI